MVILMIGISSFAFSELPLDDALSKIEGITNCAEIFSEGLHDLLRSNEIVFSHDLTYTVHSPSTDMNLSSIREPMRVAAVTVATEMARICNEIDARVMVIHPGYFSYPCDRVFAKKAFEKSVADLESISIEYGVKICIENMPKWDCFLFRYPGLDLGENGFTFDVGHANTLGNINDFIEMSARDISHFHLHDNNGDIDEHLPIGAGNIDFKALSGTLKQSKAIKIIENKSEEDAVKSLQSLKSLGVH